MDKVWDNNNRGVRAIKTGNWREADANGLAATMEGYPT